MHFLHDQTYSYLFSLFLSDVIILQGTLIIYNLGSFDPALLIVNSLSWLRLSLSVESAVSVIILDLINRGCQ